MLLQNEAYVLPPIKATWSKQQDKQCKNEKFVNVHQSVKECIVQNVRQSLNWNGSIMKRQRKKGISTNMAIPLPQQKNQAMLLLLTQTPQQILHLPWEPIQIPYLSVNGVQDLVTAIAPQENVVRINMSWQLWLQKLSKKKKQW